MKKIILVAAIVVAAFAAKAEWLYWAVSSSDATTYNSKSASLWATDGTSNHLLTTTTFSSDGWVGAPTASGTASDISSYSGSNYSYFIELGNYDSATSTYTATYKSESKTYSELANAITSSMTSISSITAYTGSSYTAVPEPTSGLMLLLGMALVGLKRKRA